MPCLFLIVDELVICIFVATSAYGAKALVCMIEDAFVIGAVVAASADRAHGPLDSR